MNEPIGELNYEEDYCYNLFDTAVVDANKALKDLKALLIANSIGNLGKNIGNIGEAYK